VRLARPADALALAPRLRAEDLAELQAASRRTPLANLLLGIQLSDEPFALLSRTGEVVALCGVAACADRPEAGCVWLLGAAEATLEPVWFTRTTRALLARMERPYALVLNAVDARHRKALRWLAALGFNESAHLASYGPGGLPFVVMVKRSSAWAASPSSTRTFMASPRVKPS
jgi:hypothetical protein